MEGFMQTHSGRDDHHSSYRSSGCMTSHHPEEVSLNVLCEYKSVSNPPKQDKTKYAYLRDSDSKWPELFDARCVRQVRPCLQKYFKSIQTFLICAAYKGTSSPMIFDRYFAYMFDWLRRRESAEGKAAATRLKLWNVPPCSTSCLFRVLQAFSLFSTSSSCNFTEALMSHVNLSDMHQCSVHRHDHMSVGILACVYVAHLSHTSSWSIGSGAKWKRQIKGASGSPVTAHHSAER